MESTSTYQALQATAPGKLEFVRKPIRDPGPGEVRIRVEACGVCHSDVAMVEGLFPIERPRVPSHEAVGKIEAIANVQGWTEGRRFGIGFLGGSCGCCEYCREGDLVNCRNQEFSGIHRDGGYAERLVARASGLMSVPDDLSSVGAAPLLCAGLTTVSALCKSSAKSGDLVTGLGIGGVGHLGAQHARHMGFEVAAIARRAEKAELANKLGGPALHRQLCQRSRRCLVGSGRRKGDPGHRGRQQGGRGHAQGFAAGRRVRDRGHVSGSDQSFRHGSHIRQPPAGGRPDG
jgi:alcohol dehydrogenase, propanol-preferring